MRNSSLVKWLCAENVTGLKYTTEALGNSRQSSVVRSRKEQGDKKVERGYERLEVYRESYQLVLKLYEITRNYPAEEKYNMISQIRRSSMSIETV